MNKIFAVLITFVLLFGSSANQAFSQKTTIASKHKQSINQARAMVADLMSKQNIAGFAITVLIGDKTIWSEGFGFADFESRIPVSRQTRFRVGSISKLFTATAAAKLYEEGLLDLDAPIQRYVANFPKKEFEITARQLAGHLAGIRHYKGNEFNNQQRYGSVSESLKIFQDDPLLHQPQTKYFYSSRGYVLLSAVIEGASKQDFLNYMRDKVFIPLNMQNTVADDNRKIVENRTRFYAKATDGVWTNEVYTDNSDRWAAGGFIMTADDMALFGAQSLKNVFLKSETRELIFTSQKTSDGKETGVGFGWRIGKDAKGRTIYHHGGASIGGRAFLIVYPESKVVVAMVANSFSNFGGKEAEEFTDLFLK